MVMASENGQLELLTSNFTPPYGRDFLHFLNLGLQETDEEILNCILLMLLVILDSKEQDLTKEKTKVKVQLFREMGMERELKNLQQLSIKCLEFTIEEVLRVFERNYLN